MRIPYGFELISGGTLEVNKDEASIVSMIFDFYMAGASLGKVVDMLHAKQIAFRHPVTNKWMQFTETLQQEQS